MEKTKDVSRPILTKKNFAKWMLCWICLGLLFLFFSNIFMHLFTIKSSDVDKNPLILQDYEGCRIDKDGRYIKTVEDDSMHLFYSIDDPSKEVSKVCIQFENPTENYMWVELYNPDAEGKYSVENMTEERLVPALKEHVMDIKPGQYPALRFDFDHSVSIKEIYAGEPEQRILYTDQLWRSRIWGSCLLFSLFLSIFLFCSRSYRIFWGKVCRKALFWAVRLYRFIDFKKLLLVSLGGVVFGGCLEAMSMYLLSRPFNAKEAIVLIALGFLLFFLYAFQESYVRKWELNALGIFLFLGLVSISVFPVSTEISWDGDTHYYGMVSMARLYQGTMTEADDAYIMDYSGYFNVMKDAALFQRSARQQNEQYYNTKYQSGTVLENTYGFNYKHIAYLPYVLGIWIAYGLGLPFCATALMAKICHLLFVALLLYASLKNLPSGKMLLLTFAMIPTVFFQVASYTYDTWLIFLLIYAFSRYFRELRRRKQVLTWQGFLGIFVPAFLALIPKYVYAPILFLMAYMPKSKWKEKKWRIAYHACFVCAALVMAAAVLYAASGQMHIGIGDGRGGESVNGDQQLQYMIHHFDSYCHTLVTFLKEYLSYANSANYLTNMLRMGVLPIQYITIALLFLAAFWDRSFSDRKMIPVLSKIAALMMPVIMSAICATAMYLVFTNVGADSINGCQPRYLLPTIFPMIYMVSRCGCCTGIRKKISVKNMNIALVGLSACFLLFHLWVHCAARY